MIFIPLMIIFHVIVKFAILADGNIVPCCLANDSISLGNIKIIV